MLKIGLFVCLLWVTVGCSQRSGLSSNTPGPTVALGAPPILRAGAEPPMMRDPVTGEFVLRVNNDAPLIEASGQDFE